MSEAETIGIVSNSRALRLVSYRRISNERPDGTSLDGQAKAIAQRIEQDGHIWFADFHDIQSGAKMDNRAGFQAALKCIFDGHADGLIVYSLDRYTRSLLDGLQMLRMLESRGKVIFAVVQQLDTTTTTGYMMFCSYLQFADIERRTIRDRMYAGRTARANQGRYAYGAPPAGYKRVIVNGEKQLVKDEKHDEILHVILKRREEGISWRGIARELSAKFPPPGANRKFKNAEWNATTVKRMAEGDGKLRQLAAGSAEGYYQPIAPEDVRHMHEMRKTGATIGEIAKAKNIGHTTVLRILRGEYYNGGRQAAR